MRFLTASLASCIRPVPKGLTATGIFLRRREEAFRGDYLTVGDMAARDADGFIRLIDRKNNLIISGGENIYPSEFETALASHAKVRDIAVVGEPDAKWGERVCAFVVLNPGCRLAASELQEWSKNRLAG